MEILFYIIAIAVLLFVLYVGYAIVTSQIDNNIASTQESLDIIKEEQNKNKELEKELEMVKRQFRTSEMEKSLIIKNAQFRDKATGRLMKQGVLPKGLID